VQNFLDILITVRDTFNHHVVFSVGVLLVIGYFMQKAAQKLKLPVITGYIIAGLILGDSVTGIIHVEMTETLRTITEIALGVIAITVGGEFSRNKLRRLGVGIATITVVQLVTTFTCVSIALIIFEMPWVYSLLLGAVASATAPAATVVIIQNLRARGDFVDTLYGIVALDDAGCVVLFATAFAIAGSVLGTSTNTPDFTAMLGHAVSEIGLSLVVGLLGGVALHFLTDKKENPNEILILSLGMIFLITAVSISLDLSPLLANMMAGAVLINLSSRGFRALRSLAPLTPPLYAAFFAIAGTELKLDILRTSSVLIFGAVFVFSRAIGKYGGVWLGATMAHSDKKVKKYLGLSMFPEGGVEIGLVLFLQATPLVVQAPPDVKYAFSQIVNIVMFAVFINLLIGPPLSKFAIIKGAEL